MASSNGGANYVRSRKKKSIWTRILLCLAVLVAAGTVYALTTPAQTANKVLVCTRQEHTHTDACYAQTLICGQEESDAHTHTDACYASVLSCGLEEHTHTDACYILEYEPETEEASAPETSEDSVSVPAETGAQRADEPSPAGETAPADEPAPVIEPAPEEDPAPTETLELSVPSETLPSANENRKSDPQMVLTSIGLVDVSGFLAPEDPADMPIFLEAVGTDIAPYLTGVLVQHLVDDQWVADTVFEDGETVRVFISYDIPEGKVTPDNKIVYYQMPAGLRPLDVTSGYVKGDSGDNVGTYSINTDGLITIVFFDEFANGNSILGTVEFSGMLSANADGSDREITFYDDGDPITIIVPEDRKYDLSLTKTGDFVGDSLSGSAYQLTVHSEKGTNGPIEITDRLTVETPATITAASYDRDSLEVWYVSPTGDRTRVTTCEVNWDSDYRGFRITGLEALAPDASYEVFYSADLSVAAESAGSLTNKAVAASGTLSAEAHCPLSFDCDVRKTGVFNRQTGLIDWTIVINPEGKDVSGWTITDNLPYDVVGPVQITTSTGTVVAEITPYQNRALYYVFPAGSAARTYYLRYSTMAPATAETVKNTVTLRNEHTVTAEGTVTVESRHEGVDKSVGEKHIRVSDGAVQTDWSLVIDLPVEEMESYSFRDKISNTVMDLGSDADLPGTLHYGIAAEIEAALRGDLRIVSDGAVYYYGDEADTTFTFTVTYFDAGGNQVSADDAETHVSSFSVSVARTDGDTFYGYQIVADSYPTWLTTTSMKELDYWSYQNMVILQSHTYDIAPAFYRRGKAFLKEAMNANGKYTGGTFTLDYHDCDGVINYRLVLDKLAIQGNGFTVTDELPVGLSYVPGSAAAYFNTDFTNTLAGNTPGIFAEEGHFRVDVTESDGGQRLTFTGTNITDEMLQRYEYVEIVFQAKLTDAADWNDYTTMTKAYRNTARWGAYESSQTTKVKNEATVLSKTGEQVYDEDGKTTEVIRYRILVNVAMADLDPNSDVITLVDDFDSNVLATLDLAHFSIYYYDRATEDHIGAQVARGDYTMSYDPAANQISLTLPDERAYVIVYDYKLNPTTLSGNSTASNTIRLNGYIPASFELRLRDVESSATALQPNLTVIKVDAEDNSHVLAGTQFRLERYEPGSGWITVSRDGQTAYETDDLGRISLKLDGANPDLAADTLFRLTEIQATPGYTVNPEPHYFIVRSRGARDDAALYAAATEGLEDRPALAEIHFFDFEAGVWLIPNDFTGLEVCKRWYHRSGTEFTGPADAVVTVNLYRSSSPDSYDANDPDSLVEAGIVLNAENGWSHVWGRLPDVDENGQPVYYFVLETSGPPHFDVSYKGNGVSTGMILVRNTDSAYALPETGGAGQGVLYALGLLLLAAAAIWYFRSRKADKIVCSQRQKFK